MITSFVLYFLFLILVFPLPPPSFLVIIQKDGVGMDEKEDHPSHGGQQANPSILRSECFSKIIIIQNGEREKISTVCRSNTEPGLFFGSVSFFGGERSAFSRWSWSWSGIYVALFKIRLFLEGRTDPDPVNLNPDLNPGVSQNASGAYYFNMHHSAPFHKLCIHLPLLLVGMDRISNWLNIRLSTYNNAGYTIYAGTKGIRMHSGLYIRPENGL